MLQLDTCTNRTSTTKAVRIPKGMGRRGEGIRTAERRSGQSCAPAVNERWSGVDSEMLPSHDGHLSLSEFAFVMEDDKEDAAFEKAGACPPRLQHPGDVPRDRSKSLAATGMTTSAFNQRRSPNSLNSDDLKYKSIGSNKAVSYHDEGRWSTRGWEGSNPFLPPSLQLRLSPRRDDGSPPFKYEGRWAPPKGTPLPLVRDQDTFSLDRAGW